MFMLFHRGEREERKDKFDPPNLISENLPTRSLRDPVLIVKVKRIKYKFTKKK